LKTAILILVSLVLLCLSPVAQADEDQSLKIKPYGYIKLDGSYDQNSTSHGNFVMWVPLPDYEGDDEQFNMTANQTRLGINLKSTGYGQLNIYGNIEFDLYGSVTGGTVAENKAILQLRHAYFSVQKGNIKLVAGQTWDLISPLNPSTVNYTVLWGCGNIGYRRPQIAGWVTMTPNEKTTLIFASGFFRTIGSDLTPTFSLATGEASDGDDDGTDAGIPSIQGLCEVKHSWTENGYIRAGVSGLWGRLKAETTLGNFSKYESRALVGHLMIAMPAGWGLSGEYYLGSNLGSYFGGILNNSTIDGLDCQGGWASAWFKITPMIKFTGGYGYDKADEVNLLTNAKEQNQAFFGNINVALAPKVAFGIEVSKWETKYKNSDTADNLRGQTSFTLSF